VGHCLGSKLVLGAGEDSGPDALMGLWIQPEIIPASARLLPNMTTTDADVATIHAMWACPAREVRIRVASVLRSALRPSQTGSHMPFIRLRSRVSDRRADCAGPTVRMSVELPAGRRAGRAAPPPTTTIEIAP
jgi:hypothetical protein